MLHTYLPVQHTAGHVLAMARVTFDHLVGWLKAGVGNLRNGKLFVVGLLGRYDWRVGRQREVDTRVGYQVSLELCQIHVKSSVEP